MASSASRGFVTWGVAVMTAAVLVPGCFGCQPLLDVRHCLPDDPGCAAEDASAVVDWDAALAQQWPEVDDLIQTVEQGRHGHAPWPHPLESFWSAFGVDGDAPRKQLLVRHGDELHRVRILEC